MKIPITFKSPEGVHDAIQRAVQDSIEECLGMAADEEALLRETRLETYKDVLSKWVRYDEYITVELDTNTHDIRVLPA